MALKTDYKDDAYEGKRKYLLIDNGDGTYSLDDVTNYKVVGDYFNGYDINTTNAAVNENAQGLVNEQKTRKEQVDSVDKKVDGVNKKTDDLKAVKYATFLSTGWSASAPYTQTVSVPGIESSDTPIVTLYIPPDTPIGSVKNITKAYGCVDRGITGNGNITLYCYNSKPTVNFQIMIKGK